MNDAAVIFPRVDEAKGSAVVARQYQSLLEQLGYTTSILALEISEDSRLGSCYMDASCGARARVAIVLESLPPPTWLNRFDRIVWVPMIDYTWKRQVLSCDPHISLLWHSRRGYERVRVLRPDLHSRFVRFGLPIASGRELRAESRGAAAVLLLHHRDHFSFPLRKFVEAISSQLPHLGIILWQSSGRSIFGNRRPLPPSLLQYHLGFLARDAVLNLYAQSTTYLSSRFNEGIGLCVLEAALFGNAVVCNAASTVAEYFPGAVKFKLPVRRKRYYVDDHYSWSEGLPDVLKSLEGLSNDMDRLRICQSECQNSAQTFFEEWRVGVTNVLRGLETISFHGGGETLLAEPEK